MPWKLSNFKGKPQYNYGKTSKESQDEEQKKKREEFLKRLESAKSEARKYEEESKKASSGVRMTLNQLLGLSKRPEIKAPITIDEAKIRALPGKQDYGRAEFVAQEPDVIQQERSRTSRINQPMSLEQFRSEPTQVPLKESFRQAGKQFLESRKKIGEVLSGSQEDQMVNVGTMVDQRLAAVSAGKNLLRNLAKADIKELAKSSDPRFIESFLKGKLPDEALPTVSEAVAKLDSPEKVKTFLSTLEQVAPKESRIGDVLPTGTSEIPVQKPSLSRFVGRAEQQTGVSPLQESQLGTESAVYSNPQELKKLDDKQALELGSQLLKEGEQNPAKAPLFDRVKLALVDKIVKLGETFVDRESSVKRLVEGKSYGPVSVSDEANVAQKLELLPGRVDVRLREVQSESENIIKQTEALAEKLKTSSSSLQKEIDQYLIAKHAPERNAIHGEKAAGMSNEEAAKIVAQMESRADGGEVKKIAEAVSAMNRLTLDLLLEGNVIGRKTYDQLRKTYPNHIPLNRIMDKEDIVEFLGHGGRSVSVPSTGLLKARGSKREVSDILSNVQSVISQAIIRVEKNRVMNSLLKFIEENPHMSDTLSARGREVVGKRFDGSPIYKELKDNQLVVRLGDEEKVITIEDPQLASALGGVGTQDLPGILKWVGAYTRLKSGLATRFNVEFAPSNIIRDTQELAIYLSAQKEIGAKGAARAGKNIPAAMRGIVDSYRKKDSEWSTLYKQMKEDGGTTGGMAISTRGDIELNIEKLRKLQQSNFKKSINYVFEKIDDWNTIFEDATRLSAYDTALKSGMTRDQAAYIAKNSTINFNRHGNAGPVVNGLYMFANASIQGSAKMIRSLKNPKVLTSVGLITGAVTSTVNRMNDSIDPEWRSKVAPWDRSANIVVLLPTNEGINYVTIPISWGLRPLKVMADAVDDFTTGHSKGGIGGFAKDFATAVIEGYNPLGGTDFGQAVTPTIGDMPIDIARNKSWSGNIISPDWMKLKSPEEQYFSSTPTSASGRAAIGAANIYNELGGNNVIKLTPEDIKYAVTDLVGGPGRTITRLTDSINAIVTGGTPTAQDIPFSNRFFKSKTEEETQRTQTSTENRQFFDQLRSYDNGSIEQKDFIRERLLSLPDDDARKNLLLKLSSGGIDTKNLRSSEAMLKMEGTYQQIQDLLKNGSNDEATKLLNELPKEQQDAYFDIRKSERAKRTRTFNEFLKEDPRKAVEYVRSQTKEEQMRLMKTLSKEEYALYNQGK